MAVGYSTVSTRRDRPGESNREDPDDAPSRPRRLLPDDPKVHRVPAQLDAGERAGVASNERAEIRRLKRQAAELRGQ